MNLIGRTDMSVLSENPFTVAENLVDKLSKRSRYNSTRFSC